MSKYKFVPVRISLDVVLRLPEDQTVEEYLSDDDCLEDLIIEYLQVNDANSLCSTCDNVEIKELPKERKERLEKSYPKDYQEYRKKQDDGEI